ncbi:SMP-30/gluconolactonase/LRE family protein [Nonomuraea rosea]|uniref:SMP-30/gluconolactonase/LRE family protein n=1 Tax=Nonomuraea rosea TaxID=638574 RepID=A0ABP7A632_9ACTN
MTTADERVIATGFAYTEGPCIGPDGTLWVVELAGGCVSRIEDGRRIVVARPGGSPNGAAFAPDGRLVFCNNGGNWGPNESTGMRPGPGGGHPAIQCLTGDGEVHTLLDSIDGTPLNAPNDLCFDQHGGYYFTDPVWARRDEHGSAPAAASPPGDVCYVSPDGTARRVHHGLRFPNGLHVTPDGQALLVGETGTGLIHRFDITAPGSLGPPATYADLGPDSFPDGMCFDRDGRLLVAGTGSGAVFVVAPGGGTVQDTVRFADPDVTNVCFGGPDQRTLFVTQASLGRVVAIEWPVPGMALFTGARPEQGQGESQ